MTCLFININTNQIIEVLENALPEINIKLEILLFWSLIMLIIIIDSFEFYKNYKNYYEKCKSPDLNIIEGMKLIKN